MLRLRASGLWRAQGLRLATLGEAGGVTLHMPVTPLEVTGILQRQDLVPEASIEIGRTKRSEGERTAATVTVTGLRTDDLNGDTTNSEN